jgi:endonuclease/exonuclease/phosphatase family metal-dependent hydrolase
VKLSSVRRALAAVVTAGLVAAPLVVSAPADAGKPGRSGNPPAKPVTVMTRNLYLGADINRPVNAALAAQAAGGSQAQVTVALANATHVTRAVVDATDFTVRAELLADEIAATEPDLIGLQEVAWWRHGPLQLEPANVGVPNAGTTDYDFLQILLDALAARGAAYEAVSIAPRADVEAPSFTGTGSPDARDVRLTMRDVVLMHVEDGLKVLDEDQAVYDHNLEVALLGNTIKFDRGYQWVDVRAGAQRFRFVNSHFEAFSSDIAYAQAAQLLAEAVPDDRTTIFVCDCNSDPLNNKFKPGDTLPHNAAYQLITGTGEYPGESDFTDEWLEWAPAAAGWTSGLSETVDDSTGVDFDHRIDMVFARTASGGALAVDRGQVTGTDVSSKDPVTGLWPSDHGGVVLRLRGL